MADDLHERQQNAVDEAMLHLSGVFNNVVISASSYDATNHTRYRFAHEGDAFACAKLTQIHFSQLERGLNSIISYAEPRTGGQEKSE